VGDIYGKHSGFQIDPDIVAGSLGKILKSRKEIHKPDIMKSIAFMVSANISHIAVLSAQNHRINQILFTGNYSQYHPYLMDSLTFGVDFHSKEQLSSYFIENGGFSGAIGCLVTK
jgi:bifunctional damage-control phosphatase, subfamily II, fusion protein